MKLLKGRTTLSIFFMSAVYAASPTMASPAGNVYIPLGDDNSIAIVDAATNSVLGKITGIPNVHGLAGTPDGLYLIAGRNDERPVGAPAPAKPAAVSADEHTAHHAKTSNKSASKSMVTSSLSVIRLKDRALIRRIDVPGAVHHVAVGPQGRYAIVTHPTQDAVSLVDLTTYDVTATIPTGPLPNYAVFSPDGKNVYVSNAGNNTVSDVDVAKTIVLRNVLVGGSPEHLVLSRDGKRLFVNNIDDGTVSAVDIKLGKVSSTFSVGSTLHGIDLSDDEKTLFVASLGDDKIASIDLESGKMRTVKLGPTPYHLANIRGTGKIYISSADKPMAWVLDQASLKVVGEIAIDGKGHQMVHVIGN